MKSSFRPNRKLLTDRGIVVNLLVSRDTPWCSVTSTHPDGEVVSIRMKREGPVLVRIPQSAAQQACRAAINGEPADPTMSGRQLVLQASAGDRIDLTIPQTDHSSTEEINGRPYRIQWHSDFVTSIDPAGTIAPLYQRRTGTGYNSSEPEWSPLIEEIRF